MSGGEHWHLFARFGVELEYMIAGGDLSVLPIADALLAREAGESAGVADVARGAIAWSNELVAHVIELKTHEPARRLEPLVEQFAGEVRHINRRLGTWGGRLLPTAMHPWMDPRRETRLWPHEYGEVYRAYDRIFDCQGHGWSNLQSTHLNLPFAGDEEFGRLHAGIRLVLPILPALAASSPVVEGRPTGLMDNRLEYYRLNARSIPSITGRVVPEPVFSEEAYQAVILRPMYADIAPQDPQGILQDEFLNSRGAIARFSRGTIEIRLLDVQECPLADVAVSAAVVGALESLSGERWTSVADQMAWPVEPLEQILLSCVREGEGAVIGNRRYLASFGMQAASATAGELWRHLLRTLLENPTPSIEPEAWQQPWRILTEEGPLARRIMRALSGVDWTDAVAARRRLAGTYAKLADCLETNTMWTSGGP